MADIQNYNSVALATGVALAVGPNGLGDVGMAAATSPISGQMPTRAYIFINVTALVTGTVTCTLEYSADGANWFAAEAAMGTFGVQATTVIAAVGRRAFLATLAWPRFRVNANLSVGTATVSVTVIPLP